MSELEPELATAEGTAVLPPEGVPQIPTGYDTNSGLYVAGQNTGNVINFNPIMTQNNGGSGESAPAEPRRIGVNESASADVQTEQPEPESPAVLAETDPLRSLVEELREELRQAREERERMTQAFMDTIDRQNQLMQRLMDRLDGTTALADESRVTDESNPEQPTESAGSVGQVEETVRPYDHELDGGVEDTQGTSDSGSALDQALRAAANEADNSPAEEAAPVAETAATQEQQYVWNPRVGDQVSVMAANGAYENDWRIDAIIGEGENRRIRAIKGYAGGDPTDVIEESFNTFLNWQVGAGKIARRRNSAQQAGETPVDDTTEYPARPGVVEGSPPETDQTQVGQETEATQENLTWRDRVRGAWDRARNAALLPFNRAYEYFFLSEDPAERRRRGLILAAASAIVASAVTAYFSRYGVHHPGGGTESGIVPGHGASEHGPHGSEHLGFIDPSDGHRRTGGVLPEGLDWGHDSAGHEIIVDNHGATVVGADQLPHGIMKANGALSSDAASALRKAGYNVGYVPMDNLTGQGGNLYAPVVS